MRILAIVGLGIAGLLATASVGGHGDRTRSDSTANDRVAEAVVDANGNLRVPSDYRTSYEFLGAWAIAAGAGQGSKGLHVVYASPGTIAAYSKDGRFPDGTVLVKEVYQTANESLSTGTVSRAQKLDGWFVMVKASKDAHPDSRLWGDGWAWSWFDSDKPTKTTSSDYKAECLPCHEPARASDLVYVDGYPPLGHTH